MTDMKQRYEFLYGTVTGTLRSEYMLPGIRNEYAPGGACFEAMADIFSARDRIKERLGVEDVDDDLELMLDSFAHIENVLCEKMFFYGLNTASHDKTDYSL